MPRTTAQETARRVQELLASDPSSLGGKLGTVIVTANLPVDACATALDASVPTLYRWMFGESTPSRVFRRKINKLITVSMWATAKGLFPTTGDKSERVTQLIAAVRAYRQEQHLRRDAA